MRIKKFIIYFSLTAFNFLTQRYTSLQEINKITNHRSFFISQSLKLVSYERRQSRHFD